MPDRVKIFFSPFKATFSALMSQAKGHFRGGWREWDVCVRAIEGSRTLLLQISPPTHLVKCVFFEKIQGKKRTLSALLSLSTSPMRQRWAASASSILQRVCLWFWNWARLMRQEGKCRCLCLLPSGPPSSLSPCFLPPPAQRNADKYWSRKL